MTRSKANTVPAPVLCEPRQTLPQTGGSWIRQPDGTLLRETAEVPVLEVASKEV